MIRGWDYIVRGCGGISTMSYETTLAGRWLHVARPKQILPAGLGFPHLVGWYESIYCLRIKAYRPWVEQDVDVAPGGNSRRALAR